MSEHTPGPWEVGYAGGITGPTATWGDSQARQSYLHPISKRGGACHGDYASVVALAQEKDPNWAANARLIASAPELLETLHRCAELLDDYSDVLDGDDGQPRPNRAMSLLQDVERVIEKAKGSK